MSKNLNNISLLDLLPPNLKVSPKQKALAKAFDVAFKEYVENIKHVVIFGDINSLNDENLDILATELMVNGYNKNYPRETKIALIKSNYFIWNAKGTPKAVEEIVSAIFGDGQVEEWFHYGGDPYMWRVYTSNEKANNEMAQEFISAITKVKNIRSHLEKITVKVTPSANIYITSVYKEQVKEVVNGSV